MARIKATTTTYQSRSEFEYSLDKVGALQLELDKEIADFNAKKALEDKAFKEKVKRKKERLNELIVSCESYASHHREELLGEKQGAETKLTNYGYRRSPGAVKTLNKKWTLAKALQSLKDAGITACVKVTESLNKNAVKDHLTEEEMAQHGLRIEYAEEFWAEAKRAEETPEKRTTA